MIQKNVLKQKAVIFLLNDGREVQQEDGWQTSLPQVLLACSYIFLILLLFLILSTLYFDIYISISLFLFCLCTHTHTQYTFSSGALEKKRSQKYETYGTVLDEPSETRASFSSRSDEDTFADLEDGTEKVYSLDGNILYSEEYNLASSITTLDIRK